MTPFDKLFNVPCGRCIGCKIERARQWAVRGQHEQSQHRTSCSLLLTIKNATISPQDQDAYCAQQKLCTKAKSVDEFSTGGEMALAMATPPRARNPPVDNSSPRTVLVPYEDGTRARPSVAVPEGTGPSLSIRDHQLFVKKLLRRLREQGPIEPIRFLMCGEYGEKNWRPHYHYVIFGYDFPDKKPHKKTRNGHQLYRSTLLEQIWPHGHADIGESNFEVIAYIARYVTKKITGPQADEHYKKTFPDGTNYWLQPEFNAMSRNPGIGNKWIEKHRNSVYPHDRVVINDKAAKPPRYYDQQLEKADPAQLEQVKKQREQRAPNSEASSPERLRAGETITHARLTKRRSLEE